jgi:putative sigma-54 modulation protein
MDVTVSAKQMELTDALRDYIKERVSRLTKFSDNNLTADVHLGVNKHRHHIHITIKGKGYYFNAETEDPANMYKAIDVAVDKLEKQFRRGKQNHHDAKFKKEVQRQNDLTSETAEETD